MNKRWLIYCCIGIALVAVAALAFGPAGQMTGKKVQPSQLSLSASPGKAILTPATTTRTLESAGRFGRVALEETGNPQSLPALTDPNSSVSLDRSRELLSSRIELSGNEEVADPVTVGDDGGRPPADPLDVYCKLNRSAGNSYIFAYGAGDIVKVWYNPAETSPRGCGGTPYPFRIDSVVISFYVYAADTFYFALDIECPTIPGDSCSGPGYAIAADTFGIVFPAGAYPSIRTYKMFFSPSVCVNAGFFVGIEWLYWGSTTNWPALINSATDCRSCNQYYCTSYSTCYEWLSNFGAGNSGYFNMYVAGNSNGCSTPIICQACNVTCTGGAIPENEPPCGPNYDDQFNGGCNSTSPTFTEIFCGQHFCGQSGTFLQGDTANIRDTDWYQLELSERDTVTWCVKAEFPVLIEIVRDGGGANLCDSTIVVAGPVTGGACDTVCVSRCLDPGTYWFVVTPSVFSGIPCGVEYEAWLRCVPCPELGPCTPDLTLTAPGSVSGTTCNAGDQCDLRAGDDRIVQVTIPYTAMWTFTLCGSTTPWDSYIYLTTTCCGGTVLDSDDDDCGFVGGLSEMSCVQLTAGTYYVDVEPWNPWLGDVCGAFTLNVAECPPCPEITCSATFNESEPNGGCPSDPDQPFNTIACGQIAHGTVTATETTRDIDGYELVLADEAVVSVRVRSEFDAILWLYAATGAGVCPDVLMLSMDDSIRCLDEVLSAGCLPAGVYHIYVASAFTTIVTPADYCLTVTCTGCPTGKCCYGDPEVPTCEVKTASQCEALGGVWFEAANCVSACSPFEGCDTLSLVGQRPYLETEDWAAIVSEQTQATLGIDNFSGVTESIGSIRFWGLDLYNNGTSWSVCGEDPMPFRIIFWDDTFGVANVYDDTLTATATTYSFNTFPMVRYDAQLRPPCELGSGWVSIQGRGLSTCWFLWVGSPIGDQYSAQLVDTTVTEHAYDLSFCLGAFSCDPADSVTAILNNALTDITVRFYAPAAGSYDVWKSTVKNNDGNPDGPDADTDPGDDSDWTLETPLHVVVAGPGMYTYDDPVSGNYANYVVVNNCSGD